LWYNSEIKKIKTNKKMKKTKIKTGFRNLLVLDFILLFAVFFIFKPFDVAFSDKAFADQLNGTDASGESAESKEFPYLKTFIISAYYSPLPCQQRYYTGSYESEKRLNGNGTNGADGKEVYPGMIAAPRTYSFGTKMDIPGIGIVAVHDRGGAIVSTDAGRFAYDRLDVWMGYGDKGLERALNWGKRTIDVQVYGVNDAITEQVTLGDYVASEATPNDCSQVVTAVATIEENLKVSLC
jgi:3D (Asp-Asp-Asp) domain-containing protein